MPNRTLEPNLSDYRLDNLSPRLFEQMIQSLAHAAICSTVTPFGDGPDGGREATFDGPTDYGPSTKRWHGHGVVQAKYRIRSEGTTRDAAWARSQLRQELKQYTRGTNPRPAPKYYIYATNVVLSPGEGAGKDSVSEILRDFAEKHQLLGYDIWDCDKIRVLLENHGEVRKAYLAWISTSDVLAELCEMLKASRRNYYTMILRYLQREMIADQYAQLEQAGHSADDKIPLSQVFIDLKTTLRPSNSEIPDPHLQASSGFVATIIADANLGLCDLGATDDRRIALAGTRRVIARKIGRYVLIGGPGQGKTTVGQYICQIFRRSLLNDVPPRSLSADTISALHGFAGQWHSDALPSPKARRIPFRIVLGDLAKSLASGQTRSLMGYLALKFNANTDSPITAEEIEHILREYPSLVVLDGLDEVPSSTNRETVMEAVSNFSIDVATGNLDVVIIATSRPQGYNDEFSSKQYAHHYLVPLAAADALKYGSQLAKTRFGMKTDRSKKVLERLSRASQNPAIVRLMQTPLQVTILTLLVDRIGTPPEERWALFNAYYRLIFEREMERDILSVAVLKTHGDDVDAIHHRVGLALQVESERSGGTDARLTVDQFSRIVEDYLVEEGHQQPQLDQLKLSIIEAAANRLVFLVGLESGQVGFEIRSLQEFMAAEGLMEGPDNVMRDRLIAVAGSSHWRNVFLFAAGSCFSGRRYLRDTIEAICFELNEDEDESFRKLLVGSELALDLLEDGPARKKPTIRRSLTRLATRLLGLSAQEGVRLAAICEDDTEDIFEEDLRSEIFRQVTLHASTAWSCLIALIEVRGGRFEDLGREVLGRYVMEDDAFRAAFGIAAGRNAWLSQVLFEFVRDTASEATTEGDMRVDGHGTPIELGPWDLSEYPPWLSWYIAYSRRSPWGDGSGEFSMHIADSGRLLQGFRLEPVASPCPGASLIPPDNIPTGRSWNIFREAGEFCSRPSAETLAAVIRTYADNRSMAARHLVWYRYPWPVGECALACHQSETAAGIVVDAIEGGRFGDIADWTELERSFADGLDLSYIMSLEPVALIEGVDLLYKFPLRAKLLRSGERERLPSSTEHRIVDALDTYSSSSSSSSSSSLIRDFLTQLLLNSISGSSRRGEGEHLEWINRVLLATTHVERFINPRFYEWVSLLSFDDLAWSKLFMSADLSVFAGPAPHHIESSLERLWVTAQSEPGQEGLLVPIAAAMIRERGLELRKAAHRLPISDSAPAAVRVASMLISIVGGAKIADVSDHVTWSLVQSPGLFNIIANAVTLRELNSVDECRELLSLIALAPSNRDAVWKALRRNFLRRRSGLAEASTWESLILPAGIPAILAHLG
jgi:hypothetical protein